MTLRLRERHVIHRGSEMSAHVSLNVLNGFGKRLNERLTEHFISFSQRLTQEHER